LLGIADIKDTSTPYAHPLIFLFLGGFIIAQAMQKWNLHKRIALNIIKVIGTNSLGIIAGFMISSAFLSMWISNTATALMMMPIAISLIEIFGENDFSINRKMQNNFSVVLLLAIAYSCSIGGVGTLIGTPPNALMAAFLEDNYSIKIGFAQWMMIGIPFVVISLPIAFFLLAKIIFPVNIKFSKSVNFIQTEIDKLGRLTNEEIKVAVVFGLVAVLWITRSLLTNIIIGISDASIAIFGSVILFLMTSKSNSRKFILEWRDIEKISWGILILFGGGLSLASGIQNSGLAEWIGNLFSNFNDVPSVIIILGITIVIIFLTELTSNLATTAAFLPIVASIAVSFDVSPVRFVVPASIAASCAFMLPVATPPNAIIFSSGQISVKQMAKAGIILNVIFVIIILLLTSFLTEITISC
jgi:sodium-dependent dicarboxylate transporter 2/3/5